VNLEWHRANEPGMVLWDLIDTETDRVMGWIENRQHYCDRGHWKAMPELIDSLDDQDAFPRYFMRLETAKQEMIDFVRWRWLGIRAEYIEHVITCNDDHCKDRSAIHVDATERFRPAKTASTSESACFECNGS